MLDRRAFRMARDGTFARGNGTPEGPAGLVPMPRYFFDIRQHGEVTADLEGEDFPDIAAAQKEAAIAATQLTPELFKGASFAFTVEVRDEDGKIVGRAAMSLDIQN
jgi:hypothetical protein